MRITTIIPCWNTEEEIHRLTQESVETINKAFEGKPYTNELIMVDNGSTFAPGYLREVADVYIRNKTNLGYPGAVNQGLAIGTGDVFCVSNNDIRVPDNVFDVGLEILKDPKIGSVHYEMIHYDEPFKFGQTTWATGKERWCTSSFFLIKREALPEGNYDLNYGRGGMDDYDFWMRVRYINGWQTAITNKSAYQHWGSWTLSKVPEIEKSDKNQAYFISKWGEEADKLFAKKHPEQWAIDYWEGMRLDDEP